MSRIGKIARLPRTVREQLNCRLLDGEEGKSLVEWLNGRPEVQAALATDFAGKPINEPNLTAWKQGGYEDWLRQQEALDVAERIVEESSEIGALAQGKLLADRVATMAALAIGEQLMAARRMEDGAEKRRAILKLVRGLVRLRATDREQERAQREEQAEERRRDYHQDWVERMRKPKEPFADLSDAELIRRMEEMRALGEIGEQRAEDGERMTEDATAFEDYEDEEEEAEEAETRGRGDAEIGGAAVAKAMARLPGEAAGSASFEVRGGEAHGIQRKASDHETHEIHENRSPDRESGAGGSIRYCRIEGI